MGVCLGKEVDALNVMSDPKLPGYGIGFSKLMFKKKKEWNVLKAFCNKHNITQASLNIVFNKFLNNKEVYLRDFRVKTSDVKNYFATYSPAMRELADVLLPFIFFKEMKSLPLPKVIDMEEVTFTRFILRSYVFCAQPLGDCMFDFFAIIRQNMKLKLRAVMYSFNLYQLLLVLMSELRSTASKKYILERVNLEDEMEISIATAIRLGTKYPLMYYLMERFRYHLRRLIWGDKFWKDRYQWSSNLDSTALYAVPEGLETEENEEGEIHGFHEEAACRPKSIPVITPCQPPGKIPIVDMNESVATRITARAIITDIYMSISSSTIIPLIPAKYDEEVTYIDDALFNKLKTALGYKGCRRMVEESGLPYVGQVVVQEVEVVKAVKKSKFSIAALFGLNKKETDALAHLPAPIKPKVIDKPRTTQFFMHVPELKSVEERIYDPKIQRDCIYNVGTGLRAWIRVYSQSGRTLKETTYKMTPHWEDYDGDYGSVDTASRVDTADGDDIAAHARRGPRNKKKNKV